VAEARRIRVEVNAPRGGTTRLSWKTRRLPTAVAASRPARRRIQWAGRSPGCCSRAALPRTRGARNDRPATDAVAIAAARTPMRLIPLGGRRVSPARRLAQEHGRPPTCEGPPGGGILLTTSWLPHSLRPTPPRRRPVIRPHRSRLVNRPLIMSAPPELDWFALLPHSESMPRRRTRPAPRSVVERSTSPALHGSWLRLSGVPCGSTRMNASWTAEGSFTRRECRCRDVRRSRSRRLLFGR
jgi:hypothetical protein